MVLDLKNPVYLKAVKQIVWQAFKNDLGSGDVTTQWFLPKPRQVIRAEVVAGEPGVLAGVPEAEWFLSELGIRVTRRRREGAEFKKGDILFVLSGRADRILAAERTLLNLLQRMSGVATFTHALVSKLPRGIKLLATRKTLWGLLDKRAVVVGGGFPHRLGLYDAVLIKDNHLELTPDFVKQWKKVVKRAGKTSFIELELDNLDDVRTFAAAGLTMPKNLVIMLDNFRSADMRKAVKLLRPAGVLIEVSGGITAKNIRQYAIPGVTAISSGSITNKAPAIDLSLRVKP